MFASGGATPLARTKRLLSMIASAINPLPNKIRISGHTDSEPFKRKDGYGNWELGIVQRPGAGHPANSRQQRSGARTD